MKEEKNNVNNESNAKQNNGSKVIIAVLAVLLIGALGFICYDKFINKEKPPISTPIVSPSPESTDNNKLITTFNEVKITSENQTITIGKNNFTVRNKSENDSTLYINDSLVEDNYTPNDTDNTLYVNAETVYVSDNFAFFIAYGQFEVVSYAIDSDGNEIKVEHNGKTAYYDYYIQDIHLDNGVIVGKGKKISDALDENINATEVELVVKYENGVVTVTPRS